MWKSKIFKFAIQMNNGLESSWLLDIELVRRIKKRSKKIITKLLTPNNILLIKTQGLPMYIYSNTIDSRLYLLAPFEPYTTELFRQAISPGSTVLDIGAQFGYFSLIAANQVGRDGRVYAFEPAPANFQLLNRNIQMNGYAETIKAIAKGVGNRHKMETLFVYDGCDSHAMHCHKQRSLKEKISIECITIDEFLGDMPVNVIKMDIEGNEPYALEGMKQTILKNQNIILFIELNPAILTQSGVNPEDFLKQLESLGLCVQLIDENSHCLKPISSDFLSKVYTDWYANLYCSKEK